MKVPKTVGTSGGAASNSLAGPAVIVVLVLILGATIYLWRARYIRRRTAYVLVPILSAAIVILGLWTYLNPM
jgi:hypothetical protein